MPVPGGDAPPAQERVGGPAPGQPAAREAPPSEDSDDDVEWLSQSLLTPSRPGRRSSVAPAREYARRMSGSYVLAARQEEPLESESSASGEPESPDGGEDGPAHEEGMYGITPWVSIDTTKGARAPPAPKQARISTVTFGNVLTAAFTAPLLLCYGLAAGLAFLCGCPRLGKRLFSLGLYAVWPYGRLLQCDRGYVRETEKRLVPADLLAEWECEAEGGAGVEGGEGRDGREGREGGAGGAGGEAAGGANGDPHADALGGDYLGSRRAAAQLRAQLGSNSDPNPGPNPGPSPDPHLGADDETVHQEGPAGRTTARRARHSRRTEPAGPPGSAGEEEPLVPGIVWVPLPDHPEPSTGCEKAVFYCLCGPLLALSHGLYIVLSFMSIVALPAASLHALLLRKEFQDVMVLHLDSGRSVPTREPIALVFRAMSGSSFSQAYFGINILVINSLTVCIVALVMGFMPEDWIIRNSTLVFVISLIAIVPLSYLIGESISQLTRKTNYAIGALLNATFGSIIEIILYIAALMDGQNKLVQMSLIGSILGCMLLLPGLAMLVGGMRNKEMKINSSLGGVTGLQFICCTLVIFSPTMFYYLYNTPQTTCVDCALFRRPRDPSLVLGGYQCASCQENMWVNMYTDTAYTQGARQLQYVSAVILFVTYVLGLVFNFVTHSFYYKSDINLPPELRKLIREDEKRIHARRQRKMVLGAEAASPAERGRRWRRGRRARAPSEPGLPEDVAALLTDKVGEKLDRSLLGGDGEDSSVRPGEADPEAQGGRRPSKAESLGSVRSQRHYASDPAVPHFTGDQQEDIELLEGLAGGRSREAVEAYRRLSSMLQLQYRLSEPGVRPETMSRLSREIVRAEKELVGLVVEAKEGHPAGRAGSLPAGSAAGPAAGAAPGGPGARSRRASLPSRLSQQAAPEPGPDPEGERVGAAAASPAPRPAARPPAGPEATAPEDDIPDASAADDLGGEGNPHAAGHVWPMWMVFCVLLSATVLIALISEGLITALDPAIASMGLSDEFAGLTFFAIVPAMSEYINAAMFAARNHLTLAMEIGRAVTLQTAYIQVPILILVSLFVHRGEPFTILFNIFDFVVVFFAVFLQMVMAESKSHNWYKGAVLLMTYASILGIFFLKPQDELPLPEA